jgi:transcriptional regulator with XRE-family HTH domain
MTYTAEVKLEVAERQLIVSLGQVLRDHRSKRRLTLTESAERAGISLGYLSQVELGKNSPSLGTLMSLCQAYGITLAGLFRAAEVYNHTQIEEANGPV